ncbi:hypothetical protein [Duganella sp. Leaf126]|nr:hypothetical protein [Duganella sp. Leaf126]
MKPKDFIPADDALPLLKSLEQLKGDAIGAALYSLIDGAKFRD